MTAWSLAACSSSHKNSPTPTTTPAPVAATASPAATVAPADLASRIGVRAGLPPNDPPGLAARFRRTPGRAPDAKPFAGEANIGDTRDFAVIRLTGTALSHQTPPEVTSISAALLAKSAHAYFYEDDALNADSSAVQRAADEFESLVWPTVTAVFGEPLIPGVDGDPRIIILQADLGGAVGGYYSGDDDYLKAVRPLSNEAEMIYMDRTLKPGGAAFSVALAHEFQHLIHARNDRAEEVWVNEGLSEDSSLLVGGAGSTIKAFAAKPSTQLNFFDTKGAYPHYGAAAAFFRYLADRFGGDEVFGEIARNPRHGAAGVDSFLASIGQPLHFRDVFADWITANTLNRDDGPYANPGRPLDVRIDNDLALGDSIDAESNQFGADYYSLNGLDGGDYVIRFSGGTDVDVLPPSALDHGDVMWSNAEDSVDTRLTRELDLTGVTDPVLTYQTWYDIERWWDWGYISASLDGGATWQVLAGEGTTDDDPAKEAYGPGYSGTSGGGQDAAWVDERVSLAQFAGKKIQIRFEYVTDGGTHGEGWAIRNVAVEQTAFRDADLSGPGWLSEGWVRLDRPLPQTYIVRLIATQADGLPLVMDMPLDASQRGELRFRSAGLVDPVLAIAGATEGTNQPAPYSVKLAHP